MLGPAPSKREFFHQEVAGFCECDYHFAETRCQCFGVHLHLLAIELKRVRCSVFCGRVDSSYRFGVVLVKFVNLIFGPLIPPVVGYAPLFSFSGWSCFLGARCPTRITPVDGIIPHICIQIEAVGISHRIRPQETAQRGRVHPRLVIIDARPYNHPFLRLTRKLEDGFVVTVEPGFYFIDQLLNEARAKPIGKMIEWKRVEQLKPFGGIRIEDNVVARVGRSENLTRAGFAG